MVIAFSTVRDPQEDATLAPSDKKAPPKPPDLAAQARRRLALPPKRSLGGFPAPRPPPGYRPDDGETTDLTDLQIAKRTQPALGDDDEAETTIKESADDAARTLKVGQGRKPTQTEAEAPPRPRKK